jgi:hypothetical protein
MGFFEKLFKEKRRKTDSLKLESPDDAGTDPMPAPEMLDEAPRDKDPRRDESGSPEENPGAAEASPETAETEAKRFDISTVYDFIQALKWSYDEAEAKGDTEIQKKLAYQLVKIETGLGAADLAANEVLVTEMEPGVLGTYSPGKNRISASRDMLEDFSSDMQLFKTVFIHEKTHKDGIADEGLTQLRTERKTSAVPGIYEGEKSAARRTFYKTGLDQALVTYDIDHPEKLVDLYLEAELEKKYDKFAIKKLMGGKTFDREAAKAADNLADFLKKGAPRLHERLKERSYDYEKKVKKTLAKIGKDK